MDEQSIDQLRRDSGEGARITKRAYHFVHHVLSSSCADCGTRESAFFVTVEGDHLTFCEGAELCSSCAPGHGVI